MDSEPQIEITADDLQVVLLMADVVVRSEGRKALRLTEPLCGRIERYFDAMAKHEKAKAEQPPTAEPAVSKAEPAPGNQAVAEETE